MGNSHFWVVHLWTIPSSLWPYPYCHSESCVATAPLEKWSPPYRCFVSPGYCCPLSLDRPNNPTTTPWFLVVSLLIPFNTALSNIDMILSILFYSLIPFFLISFTSFFFYIFLLILLFSLWGIQLPPSGRWLSRLTCSWLKVADGTVRVNASMLLLLLRGEAFGIW